MAIVRDKSGNSPGVNEQHKPSKQEQANTAAVVTAVNAVKASVDAQTPILNDIKTNTVKP